MSVSKDVTISLTEDEIITIAKTRFIDKVKWLELVNWHIGAMLEDGYISALSSKTILAELHRFGQMSIKPNSEDIQHIYDMAKKYGNEFHKAIATALIEADDDNRIKLITQFSDIYSRYLLM